MYVNGKMDMQACLENSKVLLESLRACKSDADRCKLTAELLKEELGAYNKSEADKAEYIQGVIENFMSKGANLEIYSFRLQVIKAFNSEPSDTALLWSGKLFAELYALSDSAEMIEIELRQTK